MGQPCLDLHISHFTMVVLTIFQGILFLFSYAHRETVLSSCTFPADWIHSTSSSNCAVQLYISCWLNSFNITYTVVSYPDLIPLSILSVPCCTPFLYYLLTCTARTWHKFTNTYKVTCTSEDPHGTLWHWESVPAITQTHYNPTWRSSCIHWLFPSTYLFIALPTGTFVSCCIVLTVPACTVLCLVLAGQFLRPSGECSWWTIGACNRVVVLGLLHPSRPPSPPQTLSLTLCPLTKTANPSNFVLTTVHIIVCFLYLHPPHPTPQYDFIFLLNFVLTFLYAMLWL